MVGCRQTTITDAALEVHLENVCNLDPRRPPPIDYSAPPSPSLSPLLSPLMEGGGALQAGGVAVAAMEPLVLPPVLEALPAVRM